MTRKSASSELLPASVMKQEDSASFQKTNEAARSMRYKRQMKQQRSMSYKKANEAVKRGVLLASSDTSSKALVQAIHDDAFTVVSPFPVACFVCLVIWLCLKPEVFNFLS